MGLIIVSFIAFISLGLPDGLLGVAWPGIRDYFDLPVDALGIILICGTRRDTNTANTRLSLDVCCWGLLLSLMRWWFLFSMI